jgi:hypothetical protein
MHILDQAGYDYDSTMGYNETIGFKAGTSQVYKPSGVEHLHEIPMHIQDSALFNPGRMHCSESEAVTHCDQILKHAERHKGVITVLWHQRSIGPERMWGNFYLNLVKKFRDRNAWFATAGDVVKWFRLRRAVRFTSQGEIDLSRLPDKRANLPSLILRRNGIDEQLVKELDTRGSISAIQQRPLQDNF